MDRDGISSAAFEKEDSLCVGAASGRITRSQTLGSVNTAPITGRPKPPAHRAGRCLIDQQDGILLIMVVVNTPHVCAECVCDYRGTVREVCDASGRCLCRRGVDGERCDRCRPGHHSFPSCQGECDGGHVILSRGCKHAPTRSCACRLRVWRRRRGRQQVRAERPVCVHAQLQRTDLPGVRTWLLRIPRMCR